LREMGKETSLDERMLELGIQCLRTIRIGNCARSCDACPIHREMRKLEDELVSVYREAVKVVEERIGEEADFEGNQVGEFATWRVGDTVLRVSIERE